MSQRPPPADVALRPLSTRTAVRLVLIVLLTTLAVAIAVYLVYRLRSFIVWSILALFLTAALTPSVNWLSRHRVPRALAILLLYLVVFVVIAGLVTLAGPALVREGTALIHALQTPGKLAATLHKVADPLGLSGLIKSITPQLNAIPAQLASSLKGSLSVVASGTVSSIVAVVTIGALGFFLIHDGPGLVEGSVGLFHENQRPRVRRVLDGSGNAISGYIRGNLLISAIAGAGAFIGMLVLDVPYALPLAVLLALLDLVPMIGVIVGAIPVIIAALSVSPIKGLIMLAYIVIYSQIESNVLDPLIYGRSDRLPAMVVFVAFLVASLLWGILGALIAIPTANIIRILIKEWADSRSQEPTTFAPQSDDDGSTPQGEPDARATRPP